MKMTDVERVLLLNQYAILSRLSSNEHEKSDYDLMISALSSGYDDDFEQMFSHIPEPFAIEIMNEVREILEMFRALGPREGGRIPAAAHFIGFDGNDEGEHYGYATFLLEERELWVESHRDDYNTHCPVLPEYREMLKEWKDSPDKFNLTAEDVKRIVAKAPHGCVNAV
jgi:uncharacterized protein YfbU (UPF0304 family)